MSGGPQVSGVVRTLRGARWRVRDGHGKGWVLVLVREAVGMVLRQVRTDRGWTLRQLASASACSVGYLSEVERGRKEASSEVLAAVAGALELPLPVLLTRVAGRLAGTAAVEVPASAA